MQNICSRLCAVAAAVALVLFMLAAVLHERAQSGISDTACMAFAEAHLTRHSRRHRRHTLLPLIQAMEREKLQRLPLTERPSTRKAWHASLIEAHCLLSKYNDAELAQAVAAAKSVEVLLDEKQATGSVSPTAAPSQAAVGPSGRRLGRRRDRHRLEAASMAGASSSTRRVTRGLGVFAGNDFPCDERDAFVGAPWARGACLLKCGPGSSGNAPQCQHAVQVCERLSHCATVDINVEGSVATLKAETPLSAKTSRVKHVSVTHARGRQLRAADAADGACPAEATGLQLLSGRPHCVLDCPALNCTRAIELCFAGPACNAVAISFALEGHAAVARLRYGGWLAGPS